MYWEISSMQAEYMQYANLIFTWHWIGKETKQKDWMRKQNLTFNKQL